MSQLKTPEEFYQEACEMHSAAKTMLQKAEVLNESTLRTQEKTEKVFSRFIEATTSVEPVYSAEELEQKSIDNLKAIESRDMLAVINSIVAMTIDAPEPLVVELNIGQRGIGVIAWSDSDCVLAFLHSYAFFSSEDALDRAIALESSLAEIIIEAKDNAEVTA